MVTNSSVAKIDFKLLSQHFELSYPHLLQIYHFKFKSIEEAIQLSNYISTFYPKQNRIYIELGINELFINAIEHGNLAFSFEEKSKLLENGEWINEFNRRFHDPKNRDKIVDVILELTPSHISLRVKDQGQGIVRSKIQEIETDPTSCSGRGIMLAKTLCFDEINFSQKGNEVQCLVYLTVDFPGIP